MAKCTFQSGAGSPVGVAVPKFIGQLYHDTTGHAYYRSTGLTNADWVLIANEPFVQWSPATEVATWDDVGGVGQVGDYATFLTNADLQTMSRLVLSATAITSLVANNCPVLTTIEANNCIGPFTTLDLTGCRALGSLSCFNNALTALDLSTLTALSRLDCGYNSLTTLDASFCHYLTTLICLANSLTAINVTGCAVLVTLSCDNNSLAVLDVSTCISLLTLSCGYNSLTSLDVSANGSLVSLFCSNNGMTTLNVLGCIILTTVNCSYNSLANGAGGYVNIILNDLVTNGSCRGQVTINYQTPAAPPDAGPPDGATAVTTLTASGWTVITD